MWRGEGQRLRKIASKLFDETVSASDSLGNQLFVKARQLAKLDVQGAARSHLMKRFGVRAKRVCQNEGVAPVVLGAGRGMTVSKAIQLLGVDGEYCHPSLEKRFDHRPARSLDRHRDLRGLHPFEQDVDHVVKSLSGVCK